MKKNPISREKLSAIDEWWDNRHEILDEKTNSAMTDTWKSQCISIDTIIANNYSLDYCGFPADEKITQNTDEVLSSYISIREQLENKLKEATTAVDDYLSGNHSVKLQNIASLTDALCSLNAAFPANLRASLLQSAISGNLTEQLDTDTPIDPLIEQAKTAMNNSLKGQLVKDKTILPIEESDIPFELPDSWKWVRLGEVCVIARGGSPRPISAYLTTKSDGVNWIKIGDTEKNGKYIYETAEKIKPESVSKNRMVHSGDFLLTNSMSYGRPYILKTDGCIHDGWLVISQPIELFDQDYLYWLLSSYFAYNQFSGQVSGEVVKNLNSDKVANSLFPLPPIEEQHRIVEQLEILMPLCDLPIH